MEGRNPEGDEAPKSLVPSFFFPVALSFPSFSVVVSSVPLDGARQRKSSAALGSVTGAEGALMIMKSTSVVSSLQLL